MEELRQILSFHAVCYPQMEPTDAVKLIYQNEFGGGHLIRDPSSCLRYLRAEYAAIGKMGHEPKTVDIGNGLVRVNLYALTPEALEQVGQAFLKSAAVHKGRQERFLQKLQLLRQLTEEGIFAFDTTALDHYLARYYKAGCPMVSHSEQYRTAYHPAYRIVRKELLAEC